MPRRHARSMKSSRFIDHPVLAQQWGSVTDPYMLGVDTPQADRQCTCTTLDDVCPACAQDMQASGMATMIWCDALQRYDAHEHRRQYLHSILHRLDQRQADLEAELHMCARRREAIQRALSYLPPLEES